MHTTHTISLKSNGREVAIVFVQEDGMRYQVESMPAASEFTKADVLFMNAIMAAAQSTVAKLDATSDEPSPLSQARYTSCGFDASRLPSPTSAERER